MIAKFADHLPLYRQESIFGRAGLAITRSTLAQWVGVTDMQLQPLVDALQDVVLGQQAMHADQTPVQMLSPGSRKLTAPMSGPTRPTRFAKQQLLFMTSAPAALVNMLAASCKIRRVSWCTMILLATKQLSSSKASPNRVHGVRPPQVLLMYANNKSQLAKQALHSIGGLYEIERQARRGKIPQEKAAPILNAPHTWMLPQRDLVPEGSTIAKALDYSLRCRGALARYIEDGAVPIDNNPVEVRHDVA